MGLLSFFTGVDLEAEQQRGNELDAQLAALNQKDYGPGGRIYQRIEAEQGTDAAERTYESVQANLEGSQTGDVEQQVVAAFGEGLNEGFQSTTGGIRNALSAPFEFIFKAVPWYFWIIGLGVLFFYAGGFVWLKGRLAK